MALRIAIVGPGRVGTAFAHGFVRAGAQVLGYVGRRGSEHTKALVAELGQGDILQWPDLGVAHVVVFAVGDAALPGIVDSAAAAVHRSSGLWLHTSGRHDLSVLAPAAARGARVGSLHPLLPFSGSLPIRRMSDGHALLAGPVRSMRLLRRLSTMLGLVPIECGEQNRALYHAACALAANGTTTLFAVASDLMQRAGGLADGDADRIVAALAHAAVSASTRYGPALALSGPVRRGDAATVQAHGEQLQRRAPDAVAVYAALMHQALSLAREQGLADSDCKRVAAALSLLRPSS